MLSPGAFEMMSCGDSCEEIGNAGLRRRLPPGATKLTHEREMSMAS